MFSCQWGSCYSRQQLQFQDVSMTLTQLQVWCCAAWCLDAAVRRCNSHHTWRLFGCARWVYHKWQHFCGPRTADNMVLVVCMQVRQAIGPTIAALDNISLYVSATQSPINATTYQQKIAALLYMSQADIFYDSLSDCLDYANFVHRYNAYATNLPADNSSVQSVCYMVTIF